MNAEFPVPVSSPLPVSSNVAARSQRHSAEHPSAFAKVLNALGSEIDRGERLVQAVVQGRGEHLGAGDLIALQAGIYRYTEVVDLTAKFIDRATTAVRTTLQSGT